MSDENEYEEIEVLEDTEEQNLPEGEENPDTDEFNPDFDDEVVVA
jgi:hypothetical protein